LQNAQSWKQGCAFFLLGLPFVAERGTVGDNGVRMVHAIIEYTKSAFKHGISEDNIRHAMLHPVYDEIQDEGDDKHLLLGFDSGMNLLEIVYNMIDDRTFKVFHAMKCRNSYYDKLRR
jgi:hypothetical protein